MLNCSVKALDHTINNWICVGQHGGICQYNEARRRPVNCMWKEVNVPFKGEITPVPKS